MDQNKHPGHLPRTYTLTHCDFSSNITLPISHSINNSQVVYIPYLIRSKNGVGLVLSYMHFYMLAFYSVVGTTFFLSLIKQEIMGATHIDG